MIIGGHWTLHGAIEISPEGFVKTGNTSAFDAHAVSAAKVTRVSGGSGQGAASNRGRIGLSSTNDVGEAEFYLGFLADGRVHISGVAIYAFNFTVAGESDAFKVAIEEGQIVAYAGGVMVHSWGAAPSPTMFAKVSLFQPGATVAQVVVDTSRHWGVAGNYASDGVGIWGTVKGQECLWDEAKSGSTSNEWGNRLGVTCCSNNVGSRPGCIADATFDEAKAHCEMHGLSLCTRAQIKGGAGVQMGGSSSAAATATSELVEDLSCTHLDGYMVWTADSCSMEGEAPPACAMDCPGRPAAANSTAVDWCEWATHRWPKAVGLESAACVSDCDATTLQTELVDFVHSCDTGYTPMSGSGWCQDVSSMQATARYYKYGVLSRAAARSLCDADLRCVAFVFSNSETAIIVYTDGVLCTHDCDDTSWQDDPALITQSGGAFQGLDIQYADGTCYVKPVGIVDIEFDLRTNTLGEALAVKEQIKKISNSDEFMLKFEQTIGYGAYAVLLNAASVQVMAIANVTLIPEAATPHPCNSGSHNCFNGSSLYCEFGASSNACYDSTFATPQYADTPLGTVISSLDDAKTECSDLPACTAITLESNAYILRSGTLITEGTTSLAWLKVDCTGARGGAMELSAIEGVVVAPLSISPEEIAEGGAYVVVPQGGDGALEGSVTFDFWLTTADFVGFAWETAGGLRRMLGTASSYQLIHAGKECAVGSDTDQTVQINEVSEYMTFAECAAAACDSDGLNCNQWIEYGTYGQGSADRCQGSADNCRCYVVTGGCSDPEVHSGYDIFELSTADVPTAGGVTAQIDNGTAIVAYAPSPADPEWIWSPLIPEARLEAGHHRLKVTQGDGGLKIKNVRITETGSIKNTGNAYFIGAAGVNRTHTNEAHSWHCTCPAGYTFAFPYNRSANDCALITDGPTRAPTTAPGGGGGGGGGGGPSPTKYPTAYPTSTPTDEPTNVPTNTRTAVPTIAPTAAPTDRPTDAPTDAPSNGPTGAPTDAPTAAPTHTPTHAPSPHHCDSGTHYCWISSAGRLHATCTATAGSNYKCECPAGYLQVVVHVSHGESEFTAALRHECAQSSAPTDAPTETPTDSTDHPTGSPEMEGPSNTPTESPTVLRVAATPTAFPTLAPTPEATNPPKPIFLNADFAYLLSEPTVDIASVTATSEPTKHPTAYPTIVGYAMFEKEVEVAVVSMPLSFALSHEEASNFLMRTSLEAGFAAAIGFDPEQVAMTHIDGVLLKSMRIRRQLSNIDVTFDVTSASNSTAQVEDLKNSILSAASEGSIVANIQKEAAAHGVLVDSLKSMPRKLELNANELQAGVKYVTVFESVRDVVTDATDSSGDSDETTGNIPHEQVLEVGEIIGIVACVVGILVLLAQYNRRHKPKQVDLAPSTPRAI
jgi:hypothetical protein